MRNLKLVIEYDGTEYLGWQRQTSDYRLQTTDQRQKAKDLRNKEVRRPSIQATIEQAIFKITGERVNLIGSGRTDSGVHAKGQVANFKIRINQNLNHLIYSLNSVLPKDIIIKGIKNSSIDFNSRYDAKAKVYRYSIINSRYQSPFYRRFYTHIAYPLDFDVMKKECKVLIGKNNFESFRASDKKDNIDRIREIYSFKLIKKGKLIFIDAEADGFLYKMIRNIVGTLIEIGKGRFSAGSMKNILEARDRTVAGPTAPAQGLCLMKVKY